MANATFTIVVNLGAGTAADVSAEAQELGKYAARLCARGINNKTSGTGSLGLSPEGGGLAAVVPANASLVSAAVA